MTGVDILELCLRLDKTVIRSFCNSVDILCIVVFSGRGVSDILLVWFFHLC